MFDEVVSHYHFKMDSLSTITKLVTKNCFKAAIDLKDAYFSIRIRSLDRKCLLFIWEKGTLYEFTCHPNGLSCAPRIFTKILRPPLSSLICISKVTAVAHLDDLYLQGQTYDKCIRNVIDTTVLLDKLGLVVHPEKSVFIPTQVLTILGFGIKFSKNDTTAYQGKSRWFTKGLYRVINMPIFIYKGSGNCHWKNCS